MSMMTAGNHNTGAPDEFELHMKLLIVALWRGGYPHEIMVFMFNKLFERDASTENGDQGVGRSGKKAWPPRRIVREKSDRQLWHLCRDLEREFLFESNLPGEVVSACFQLLYRNMLSPLDKIIKPEDQTARRRWKGVLGRFVAETTLRDYYGKKPEADISNWSYKVLRRVRSVIVDEGWLSGPYETLLTEAAKSFRE